MRWMVQVQLQPQPGGQCAERVGRYGCGGDRAGPEAQVSGLLTRCRVEGTWFAVEGGRKKRGRLGWVPGDPGHTYMCSAQDPAGLERKSGVSACQMGS